MMKDDPTPSTLLEDASPAAHFEAGSALREFIAGRLGAPGCWPNKTRRKHQGLGASVENSSIQRWETDGGTTAASQAAAHRLYATRPLLTQLI